ncbi:MAG: hypothetical protein CMJ47_12265 [Planctomyces sp.]|nr:hypothetical protein [Planctomyces sp.]
MLAGEYRRNSLWLRGLNATKQIFGKLWRKDIAECFDRSYIFAHIETSAARLIRMESHRAIVWSTGISLAREF